MSERFVPSPNRALDNCPAGSLCWCCNGHLACTADGLASRGSVRNVIYPSIHSARACLVDLLRRGYLCAQSRRSQNELKNRPRSLYKKGSYGSKSSGYSGVSRLTSARSIRPTRADRFKVGVGGPHGMRGGLNVCSVHQERETLAGCTVPSFFVASAVALRTCTTHGSVCAIDVLGICHIKMKPGA